MSYDDFFLFLIFFRKCALLSGNHMYTYDIEARGYIWLSWEGIRDWKWQNPEVAWGHEQGPGTSRQAETKEEAKATWSRAQVWSTNWYLDQRSFQETLQRMGKRLIAGKTKPPPRWHTVSIMPQEWGPRGLVKRPNSFGSHTQEKHSASLRMLSVHG